MWTWTASASPSAPAVHTLEGYSAHADQKDLLNFIDRMRRKPRQVRLVHGDERAKQALAAAAAAAAPGGGGGGAVMPSYTSRATTWRARSRST
jgi:Cft2 family RNA processing exonuclease